jgi:hypothetical protein
MGHPRTQAERDLENETRELAHRIHDLDDHIHDAEHKLRDRQRDADVPEETVAGRWEDESSGAQRGG